MSLTCSRSFPCGVVSGGLHLFLLQISVFFDDFEKFYFELNWNKFIIIDINVSNIKNWWFIIFP